MSGQIKVIAVQIAPIPGNKEQNLKKVAEIIEKCSCKNPDLVVLPEVFNSSILHEHFHPLAERIPNGRTSEFIADLAVKYNTNIVAGSFVEKCDDEKYKNTSVIFNRSGNIIGKYSKIHMFSYYGSDEGKYITTGDSAVLVETDFGKIGLSICYDLRFPELYRSLTYAGAELIVCPAAWPTARLEHWITLNKARAIENLIFMISVNQCGKYAIKRKNAGNSMIISPWGEIISSAGLEEGSIYAEIDLDEVKKRREEFPVLNDRNLEAYKNFIQ